ncbi:MAG: glycosyltransferase family 4 protein [Anaerolineae bacterium]|nr:glycosyltransferase family 4 protein [Anaerolineae bacterium]
MSPPRRILMIAPTSFFLDYGCHVRILEEARALQTAGQHVRIVTYYLGRNWPGLDIVRSSPTPWRADYEVGSSRHKIAFDVLLFGRALREALRWRPDVIHGHLHEGALIGTAIGRLLGVPSVFDFQGSLTGEMLDHGFIKKDGLAYTWWRRLEDHVIEMPDVIVTSTSHSAVLLAQGFGRTEAVHPLPDSVNLDFFSPDCLSPAVRAADRQKLGLPPDRQIIVYLGLLADYQGVPQLLQALAQLRARDVPVSCLVMGFPGMEYYAEQAHNMGLTPQDVVFTGKIPYDEAPKYLALGDVAVAPKLSATEGSGKILNYMAMGLPVVAYDTPVSREYLGSLGVYAAPVGDVTALADALASLVTDPEAAQALGVRLRQRADRHFSWARTGRQLMHIYDGLTDEGPEHEGDT